MKLADSLNPATQAENIKKLNAGLEAVDAKTLPSTSTATTGQILKLTGENKTPNWVDEYSYTPPAYSETEVNTGQKWIDGKDIYSRTFVSNFTTIAGQSAVPIATGLSGYTLINVLGYAKTTSDSIVPCNCYIGTPTAVSLNVFLQADGYLVANVTPGFSECYYAISVLYTKPDPETRDDDTEAPEEKKTTRKKTTNKKED